MKTLDDCVVIEVGKEKLQVRRNEIEQGFVPIRILSRFLHTQDQYLARYLSRDREYPFLGEGLRVKCDDAGDYHSWSVFLEDIPELVKRYKSVKNE